MVECCATASTTFQPKREPGILRENCRLICAKPHITYPVEHGVLLRLILIVFNVLCSWWNWSLARLGRTRGRGGIAAGKQLWQPSWAAVWPKYSQHQVVPSHLPKCWLLCHFLQAVCNQLKQSLWLSSWHVIAGAMLWKLPHLWSHYQSISF